MRKIILTIILVLMGNIFLYSQKKVIIRLSLEDCIKISLENDANVQLLYNQIDSAVDFEIKELSREKIREEIAVKMAALYFSTTTNIEQRKLIEENIARAKQTENIAYLFAKNNKSKQIDYERIQVNLENLYTQLSNTEAAIEQQLNRIKYKLGIPLSQEIALIEDSKTFLLKEELSTKLDLSSHIDIRILNAQKETLERYLEDKEEQLTAEYINTLNDYCNYKNNVDRQEKNLVLAEKIHLETSLKYKDGMSTMNDLLQDEMNLSNAQSAYLNALCGLREIELKIMLLNGEINNIFNK